MEIEDLLSNIEDLNFEDESLDSSDVLFSVLGLAAGVAAGPVGMTIVASLSKAKHLNQTLNMIIKLIKNICDDPNINIDNSYFREILNEELDHNQFKILQKVSKMNNINLVDVPVDERWA